MGVLSFLPETAKESLHTRGHLHRLAHLLVFCSAAWLLMRATRRRGLRIVTFVTALALGYLVEMGQHLIYSSNVEWSDIWIDTLGSCVGLLLAMGSGTSVPMSE